jgi:glucose-6-phosphate 1-dehydrogenase
MHATHSDALVFFGATGDLAYKKIFPSLHAMLKRGNLNVPVIGVAKSSWDLGQLTARAKDSLEKHGVAFAIGMNSIAAADETVNEPLEISWGHCPSAEERDAYERVLTDAMAGDATLFAREDYVEEAWRIVDPALKAATPVFQYEPHTWGPTEVERVTPVEGWENPVVNGHETKGSLCA